MPVHGDSLGAGEHIRFLGRVSAVDNRPLLDCHTIPFGWGRKVGGLGSHGFSGVSIHLRVFWGNCQPSHK